jgi:hypothetical protein
MTRRASAAVVLLLTVACKARGTQAGELPPATQDLRGRPFEELHAPTGGLDGSALILGALEPGGEARGARARFVGRWEGYDLALPVPRDWKVVLVVEEIHGDRGTVVLWAGTNSQRPSWVVRFIIPPDGVRETVEALRAAGVTTEWKLLPENGHDTWTDTYSDPAFYEWMLAKTR